MIKVTDIFKNTKVVENERNIVENKNNCRRIEIK